MKYQFILALSPDTHLGGCFKVFSQTILVSWENNVKINVTRAREFSEGKLALMLDPGFDKPVRFSMMKLIEDIPIATVTSVLIGDRDVLLEDQHPLIDDFAACPELYLRSNIIMPGLYLQVILEIE